MPLSQIHQAVLNKTMLMKNSVGFTLVELLVAIVIIVILSTIGITSFNSASARNELQNQAKEIQSLARKLYTDGFASSKPSDCENLTPPRYFYGTFLSFQITNDAGTPTEITYGPLCYQATAEPNTEQLINLEKQFHFRDDVSLQQIGLESGTLGIQTSGSITHQRLVIVYRYDGEIRFLDHVGFTANQVRFGAVMNGSYIYNGSETVLSTPRAFADIGDGNNSYRINFSKSGLTCVQALPISGNDCND